GEVEVECDGPSIRPRLGRGHSGRTGDAKVVAEARAALAGEGEDGEGGGGVDVHLRLERPRQFLNDESGVLLEGSRGGVVVINRLEPGDDLWGYREGDE